jgi:hypothetical protein
MSLYDPISINAPKRLIPAFQVWNHEEMGRNQSPCIAKVLRGFERFIKYEADADRREVALPSISAPFVDRGNTVEISARQRQRKRNE